MKRDGGPGRRKTSACAIGGGIDGHDEVQSQNGGSFEYFAIIDVTSGETRNLIGERDPVRGSVLNKWDS